MLLLRASLRLRSSIKFSCAPILSDPVLELERTLICANAPLHESEVHVARLRPELICKLVGSSASLRSWQVLVMAGY